MPEMTGGEFEVCVPLPGAAAAVTFGELPEPPQLATVKASTVTRLLKTALRIVTDPKRYIAPKPAVTRFTLTRASFTLTRARSIPE
jgi:hypothetical protein